MALKAVSTVVDKNSNTIDTVIVNGRKMHGSDAPSASLNVYTVTLVGGAYQGNSAIYARFSKPSKCALSITYTYTTSGPEGTNTYTKSKSFPAGSSGDVLVNYIGSGRGISAKQITAHSLSASSSREVIEAGPPLVSFLLIPTPYEYIEHSAAPMSSAVSGLVINCSEQITSVKYYRRLLVES